MRRPRRGCATLFAAALQAVLLAAPAPAAAAAEKPIASTGEEPALPVPAATYRVHGVVQLLEKGKPSSDPTLQPRKTVVVFEPALKPRAPRALTAEMSTAKKEFAPRLLVVPVGSTVRFPNLDPILHNVFSISGRNSFDLGLLGKGPGKVATFREPGIVRVFCNVHHGMFAYVYVVATPHWATAGEAGKFELQGLPAGPGRLTIWNERSAPTTVDLTLPARSPVTIGVEITMPRIPPHKNKLGKSYTGGNYG